MAGGKSLRHSTLLQNQNKIVIGMFGTLSGVGVTYSAISLATYLSQYCHYRVALVENNNNMHFAYLKRAAGIIGEADHFCIGKIDFYTRSKVDIWLRLQSVSYDYVLVDYGVYEEGEQVEYARCNYRFLIGSLCEWKRAAYEDIIQSNSTGLEISFYLATLGQRYDIKEYKREFGKRLYGIPCIYDPFLLVKEIIQFWKRFSI